MSRYRWDMGRDQFLLAMGRCDGCITQQCPAAWVTARGNIQNTQQLAEVDLVLWELQLIQFGGPSLRKETQP